MELILYRNDSSNEVVTKKITALVTLNGTLREGCSIIDPVIMISNTSFNNAHAAVCNYAKIAQFGRYYYVNDIVSEGNMWILHMHVDVLASFQTQLKSLSGVIERNEFKYNTYLQDGYFRTYANPHIEIKQFPSGFDTFEYVLAVSGGGSSTPPSTRSDGDDIDSTAADIADNDDK